MANNIKIHITSEIKACSSCVNGSDAWVISDVAIGVLAKRLMKFLNIPIVTNSALRVKVDTSAKD